jgi:hypothetical protein
LNENPQATAKVEATPEQKLARDLSGIGKSVNESDAGALSNMARWRVVLSETV